MSGKGVIHCLSIYSEPMNSEASVTIFCMSLIRALDIFTKIQVAQTVHKDMKLPGKKTKIEIKGEIPQFSLSSLFAYKLYK